MWLFIILAVVVLVAACVTTYFYAEHHELHKVRAEFDHILDKLGPSSRYRQGIELAEKVVNEMDENLNGDYVESGSTKE